MTIRLVLADDQTIVRAGFRALFDLTDDLQVVGEAADGPSAVTVTRRTRPDVVLMDIRMPGHDGLEAARRILADPGPHPTRVLVLTTFGLDEYVFDALSAGASGFLLKDVDPDDLYAAVRAVAAGGSLLDPAVTRAVVDELTRLRGALTGVERLDVLTDRERDVVALVARGLTNEQIGARLAISPLTAKTHVSRALIKLGLRDRVQLVVLAYETGLVRAGDPPRPPR
ncbi:response regulator transcription factor [Cryptosporangium arvum]|uniref:response regulator transcription factor n=1 Tax=Cryptosporangium arvum TaxID=80871 RepID=UPI0004BA5BC6|nr:response regulator transcription factor [Cryptosporangium arvum]